MATTHKITTELQYKFPINHEGEYESSYPEVEITYAFAPGTPQTYDDPGSGPEIDFLSARIIESGDIDPDAEKLAELAEEWLDGKGREAATESAGEDLQAERERALEYRAESRRDMEKFDQ